MDHIFENIYRGKKVFLTGHTGFKGSWMSYWLTKLGAEVCGYSLAPPTRPNHFDLLKLEMKSHLEDIRNFENLNKTMVSFAPDIVFHMAAQALVRQSYHDPIATWSTNVQGSLNVYEAVRNTPSVAAIVSITTDKVYQNKEWEWGYRENDRLGGHDPYSASKAAMEILTASYRQAFFNKKATGNSSCLLAVARAGNVIGGGDWATDRLIPDLVKTVENGNSINIRSPKAVRPWQHVLEPLSGYLSLGQKLLENQAEFGDAYNFGPSLHEKKDVFEVASFLKTRWSKVNFDVTPPKDPLHEAHNLQLDISKAKQKLNWHPIWNTEKGLEKTINWYKCFAENGTISTSSDLQAYIKDAKEAKCSWAVK